MLVEAGALAQGTSAYRVSRCAPYMLKMAPFARVYVHAVNRLATHAADRLARISSNPAEI